MLFTFLQNWFELTEFLVSVKELTSFMKTWPFFGFSFKLLRDGAALSYSNSLFYAPHLLHTFSSAPSDKEIKKAQALKEEGNALVKKGEHKKAIEKYSQSLKHNPTEVTTYTNRWALSISICVSAVLDLILLQRIYPSIICYLVLCFCLFVYKRKTPTDLTKYSFGSYKKTDYIRIVTCSQKWMILISLKLC